MILPGVTGQTPEKKQYKATRLTTAPAIDGILDDEVWKEGSWIDDFTQYEPYNGVRFHKEPNSRSFLTMITFMLHSRLMIQVPTVLSTGLRDVIILTETL